MKRYLAAFFVIAVAGFAHQSISQDQPLIEPEMTIHDLFGMEPRSREGFQVRLLSAATIRLLRSEIEAGYATTRHNHPDEEIVLLLEGRIRAYSGDEEFDLEPGELFLAPAYVDHYYEALEDSVTIEFFGPGRTFGGGGMGMGP